MKITPIATILIFFLLMISAVSASIVINEIELDPSTDDPNVEIIQWIELYNGGNEDVDISGFAVFSFSNRSKDIIIDEGTIISAKSFFVVSSSRWLNKDGDSIALKDESGFIIDRTPFFEDIYGDDCSWSRYPDGESEWGFMGSSEGGPSSGELCEEKGIGFIKLTMDQNIHGVGFANVRGSIASQEGSKLESREHGSGSYTNENILGYLSGNQTGNPYINLRKKNSMEYKNTVFKAGDTRSIDFGSRWTSVVESSEDQSTSNMQESYRYANNVDAETRIGIVGGISRIAVDSEFNGAAEVKYASSELRSVEDYMGSFRISENFSADYFNKSAFSTEKYRPIRNEKQIEDMLWNKSASTSGTAGYGFVRVEKQIGDKLRTYEHGSGIYITDEVISTDDDKESMVKDITLIHGPVNYSYSPQTSLNLSIKWREGIYSKEISEDKTVSFIAEDFSDISKLKKETIVNGSKAMRTQASFVGKARLRTDIEESSGTVHQDDEYYGSYDIARKVIKLPEFEKPHFSIIKRGRVSSQRCDILDYSIVVFNDGNMTLGPIYVKDSFPTGTQLIDTDLMPLELTARSANWSIQRLGIGESITINAKLKTTKRTNSTINRVRAYTIYEVASKGISRMKRLSASNTSTMNITWDECEPISLSASMSATPDKSVPNIVRYRLNIENLAEQNMSINATVSLPEGIKFLNSTTRTSSTSDDKASWSISNLVSGKKKAISFMGVAEGNGLYESKASIYGYSEDGHELASENVTVPVLIGKYIEFAKMNASEWLPCSNDPKFRSITGADTEKTCCDLW
jgi:hypothetical protein